MIYDFFVVDSENRTCVFHYREEGSTFWLPENIVAKLVTSISAASTIFSTSSEERIQKLETTSFKISFEIVGRYISMLVASNDHDDLELDYLISELTNEVQSALQRGDIRFIDISNYIIKGKVRISNPKALYKTLMLRLGDVIRDLKRMDEEIDVLNIARAYNASDIAMINMLMNELKSVLSIVSEKISKIPHVPGS
ncbi:MAG: hypothetical protein ACTSR0_07735 [Candidatus Asgardarchaeia archaeon]